MYTYECDSFLLYSINSYKEYFFLVENSDINGFINIINSRNIV